jgi:NADPH:quinone reductase-like Zn-dependent oxidoreductase
MRVITASSHGGPEVLRVEERPAPQAQADDVVVEVKEAGVNASTSTLVAGCSECFGAAHSHALPDLQLRILPPP